MHPPVANRILIRGGVRRLPRGARAVERVARDVTLDLTLHLRQRRDRAPARRRRAQHPTPLTHDEFALLYGAHPNDVERGRRFARRYGLIVMRVNRAARTLVCRGPAAAIERAFGVRLVHVEHERRRYRTHVGAVSVPRAVGGVIRGVLGLDDRPAATAHVRHFTSAHKRRRRHLPPDLGHYLPSEIVALYDFPDSSGSGQCIGIIELDGGFRYKDLAASFRRMSLPMPTVTIQRIHGAMSRPTGRPMGPDAEVALDLVMAGAAAPGAHLVVYFAPCTERGFVDAVKAAVHDRENRPSVLSISWGNPEPDWSRQAMRLMNATLRDAAALGITVCASSGDLGSSGGRKSAVAVNFPASSPYVLACGATRALARRHRIVSEVVWNDLDLGFGATGGGASAIFKRPGYQADVDVPGLTGRRGRGVPDVAGNGDPETGYVLRVDGKWLRLGGTSAVAPLWAGLVARMNGPWLRRLGLIHHKLYRLRGTTAFRAITDGDNGAFRAGPIWNACTGLGSPRADHLTAALVKP